MDKRQLGQYLERVGERLAHGRRRIQYRKPIRAAELDGRVGQQIPGAAGGERKTGQGQRRMGRKQLGRSLASAKPARASSTARLHRFGPPGRSCSSVAAMGPTPVERQRNGQCSYGPP